MLEIGKTAVRIPPSDPNAVNMDVVFGRAPRNPVQHPANSLRDKRRNWLEGGDDFPRNIDQKPNRDNIIGASAMKRREIVGSQRFVINMRKAG